MSEQRPELSYAITASVESAEPLPDPSDTKLSTERAAYFLRGTRLQRYESALQQIREQRHQNFIDPARATRLLNDIDALSRQELDLEASRFIPDWQRYEEIPIFDFEHGYDSKIHLLPDNRLLVITEHNSYLYDIENNFRPVKDPLEAGGVIVTTDSKTIVDASDDMRLRFVDIETGTGTSFKLPFSPEIRFDSIHYLANGRIAATFDNGAIAIINPDQPDNPIEKLKIFAGTSDTINSPLVETPEGLLVIGVGNRDVYVLDTELETLAEHQGAISHDNTLAITPDNYLVVGTSSQIELRDLKTKRSESTFSILNTLGRPGEYLYTPDDKIVMAHMLTGDRSMITLSNGTQIPGPPKEAISVVDRWSGKTIKQLEVPEGAARMLLLPNGQLLTAPSEGRLRVYGVKDE